MRNIVLICLDTVRKDFFDEYAPQITKAADVSIKQGRATSAWSTPSHASMISGQLAHEHGVHTYNKSFDTLPESQTFFSDLDHHSTLGVSANVFAGPGFGFDQYFDEFRHMKSSSHRFLNGIDPNSYVDYNNLGNINLLSFFKDALRSDAPLQSLGNGIVGGFQKINRHLPFENPLDAGAKPLVNTVIDLVRNSDEPYFLFVNFMNAHLPLAPHQNLPEYEAPASWSTHGYDQWEYMGNRNQFEEYWQYREALYGAMIEYLDQKVIQLVDRLWEKSDEHISFIITADHGENLGFEHEDGLVNHTSSLSEGLLHVPWSIIGAEGVAPPGDRIVSHLDLPALISSLATGDQFEWSETPRAEVIGMGPNPEPPSRKEFWDRTIRAVYDGTNKYVWDSLGNETHYEIDLKRSNFQRTLNHDFELPDELSSVFQTDIDVARSAAKENEGPVSVSTGIEDRLEELGYL